jgi:OTU domain-containing protein 5
MFPMRYRPQARDKEHFSQFITDEPFEQYIRRKRQDGVHGNNPEIQAISELFNRPIEVFVPENGATPLNIFHAEYKTQDAPIRLSYHDGNHYNAVVDPLVPTAGLGLGLPGLQPRLADQREFERALEESNNDQLQRAIKESTLSVDNVS